MRWTRQQRRTSDADPSSPRLRRDWYQDRRAAFVEMRCGRRSRVVLMPRRWHHVGGHPPVTVTKTPDHRGEREGSRKTIGQGRPDCSGVPVVTYSCAFYLAHEAAGAQGIRLSLRPPLSRAIGFRATWANPAAGMRKRARGKRFASGVDFADAALQDDSHGRGIFAASAICRVTSNDFRSRAA